MVPLPYIPRPEAHPQDQLAGRFCLGKFWEESFDQLLSPDLVVDFPHAPPGMLQHMDRFEFDAFRFWLRNTVRELEVLPESAVLPTTDPEVFWAVRFRLFSGITRST